MKAFHFMCVITQERLDRSVELREYLENFSNPQFDVEIITDIKKAHTHFTVGYIDVEFEHRALNHCLRELDEATVKRKKENPYSFRQINLFMDQDKYDALAETYNQADHSTRAATLHQHFDQALNLHKFNYTNTRYCPVFKSLDLGGFVWVLWGLSKHRGGH